MPIDPELAAAAVADLDADDLPDVDPFVAAALDARWTFHDAVRALNPAQLAQYRALVAVEHALRDPAVWRGHPGEHRPEAEAAPAE